MKKIMNIFIRLTVAGLLSSFILIPAKPVFATVIYRYEWVSQSGTVSPAGYAHQYTGLVAGQTVNLSLTLINRSGTTIIGEGSLPSDPTRQVPVGTWGIGTQNPQDGTPYFLDKSSFVLNRNRFVYYDGVDVPNGGKITFNWTIKLANGLSDGVYDLYYRPVSEYKAWTRQFKNGRTLPGTDSDIFTRLIVGSGQLTYTSNQAGYTFNYLNIDNDARADSGYYNPEYWLETYLFGYKDRGVNGVVDVWLANPEQYLTDVVEIYHGGSLNDYGGPKEHLNMAVFNVPWNVFYTNLADDCRFAEKGFYGERHVSKSGVLYTANNLQYFILTRTHESDSWMGKTYVIEIGSDKTAILNTYSRLTEFILSILDSIRAV